MSSAAAVSVDADRLARDIEAIAGVLRDGPAQSATAGRHSLRRGERRGTTSCGRRRRPVAARAWTRPATCTPGPSALDWEHARLAVRLPHGLRSRPAGSTTGSPAWWRRWSSCGFAPGAPWS